ncbi:hypothetical protein M404DRAFT_33217 [Pisolithus tinctorius Marx 270]|uniref:Uncharacterized protein n=1 Tax=Pisolithus tinctorius Marx 270 TaxID=870435 RepID=A0A0C3NLK4_PISTI|nr:hypothetical protein M404DRAFT_33217 [Pisolithus tinctorius Marx 270]
MHTNAVYMSSSAFTTGGAKENKIRPTLKKLAVGGESGAPKPPSQTLVFPLATTAQHRYRRIKPSSQPSEHTCPIKLTHPEKIKPSNFGTCYPPPVVIEMSRPPPLASSSGKDSLPVRNGNNDTNDPHVVVLVALLRIGAECLPPNVTGYRLRPPTSSR